VLGHVLRGNAGADIVDGRGPLFDELDTALYAVHLPVFAFLSGLFVRRAVERDGRQTYLRSRLTLFAYLYVLWTVLQGAVKLVTGSLANSPLTARGLAESLWLPDTQMWFLPFLALVTCASVVVPPWGDRTRLALGTLVALVVSGVAWGLNGAVAGSQGLGLAVFFWVGVVVGPEGVSRLRCRPKVLLAAGGAVFVGVLALSDPVVATSSHEPRSLATSGLGVIASVAGVVAVLCLGQVLDRGPVAGWLLFLGQCSLEIFLAHIIFTAATRITLEQVGVHSVAPHLALGTLVGIAGPLALWWLGHRMGVPWLFSAPRTRAPASRR